MKYLQTNNAMEKKHSFKKIFKNILACLFELLKAAVNTRNTYIHISKNQLHKTFKHDRFFYALVRQFVGEVLSCSNE